MIFSRDGTNIANISPMKKTKKIIFVTGLVVVVIFISALIIAALFLDRIVKTGVETVGSKITRVSITLDSVHVGLLTGSAKVKDLVVGNPEGFKTPNAISIGVAEVGVNPWSVLSDKIVIRSIHVESPEITFEGGLGGNNLSKILANVNGSAKTSGPASTNAVAASPGKKFEVDDFLITGAKVHVSLTGFGGKQTTLALPAIHLANLGKGSDGITAADLTKAVLSAITSATVKAVAEDATNVGKDMENLGKNAGADKIKKGIGKIFGK
jgi:uncharacterized protein involved in outer membrane biogenesis